MNNKKSMLGEFGSDILQKIRDDANDRLDDARIKERIEGIRNATKAMKEAKIPKDKIVNLLVKYWDLRPSEAKAFVEE